MVAVGGYQIVEKVETMNPLYIGAGARWLIIVAGTRGLTVSEDLAIQTVSAILAFGALAWSFHQKKQQMRERRQ